MKLLKYSFIHIFIQLKRSLFFMKQPEYREVYPLWNYQNTKKFRSFSFMKLPEHREAYPLRKLSEYSRVYSLWNYQNTEKFILYETTRIQRSLSFMKLQCNRLYTFKYNEYNIHRSSKFLILEPIHCHWFQISIQLLIYSFIILALMILYFSIFNTKELTVHL